MRSQENENDATMMALYVMQSNFAAYLTVRGALATEQASRHGWPVAEIVGCLAKF